MVKNTVSFVVGVAVLAGIVAGVWFGIPAAKNLVPERAFTLGEGIVFEDYTGAKEDFFIDLDTLRNGSVGVANGGELIRQIGFWQQDTRDDLFNNDFDAYMGIGFNSKILSDWEGALRAYRAALEINPRHFIALNNLGDIYHEQGELAMAEASYIRNIRENPTKTASYRKLLDLYRFDLTEKRNNIADVVAYGVEQNGEDLDILSWAAVYYQEEGDREHAIAFYERLLAQDPGNASYRQELANLRAQR